MTKFFLLLTMAFWVALAFLIATGEPAMFLVAAGLGATAILSWWLWVLALIFCLLVDIVISGSKVQVKSTQTVRVVVLDQRAIDDAAVEAFRHAA